MSPARNNLTIFKVSLISLLSIFSFLVFTSIASAGFAEWGASGETAGIIQIVPDGYALTAIGYGSDDHLCRIGIKTAPVRPDGSVDFSEQDGIWNWTSCSAGVPGSGNEKFFDSNTGDIVTGWTWGAQTSGGKGYGPSYDDAHPPSECFYQEYMNLSTKLSGYQYMGTCADRGYAPGELKAIARAVPRSDGKPRVITGIHFNIGGDAKLDYLAEATRPAPRLATLSVSYPQNEFDLDIDHITGAGQIQNINSANGGSFTIGNSGCKLLPVSGQLSFPPSSIRYDCPTTEIGANAIQPFSVDIDNPPTSPGTYEATLHISATGTNGTIVNNSSRDIAISYTALSDTNPTTGQIDIKCNGTDGPCDVNSNSTANISWAPVPGFESYSGCTVEKIEAGSSISLGSKPNSGSFSTPVNNGSTTTTYTYKITCQSDGTSIDDSVDVHFIGAITCSISANPTDIDQDQSTHWTVNSTPSGHPYFWHVSGAATATDVPGEGTVTPWSGDYSYNIPGIYQVFVHVADGANHQACTSNTVTLTVFGQAADLAAGGPTVNFTDNDHTTVSSITGLIANIGKTDITTSFQNILQIDINNNNSIDQVLQKSLPSLAGHANSTLAFTGNVLSSLPAGTHAVRVCANQDINGVHTVTEPNYVNNCGEWVPFTVNGGSISVFPSSFSFAVDRGTNPPSQVFYIGNDRQDPIRWTVSKNVSWLNVSPSGPVFLLGDSTSQPTLSVNSASLNIGTYNGIITVSAVDANTNLSVGTKGVPVSLTVRDPALAGVSLIAIPNAGPMPLTGVILSSRAQNEFYDNTSSYRFSFFCNHPAPFSIPPFLTGSYQEVNIGPSPGATISPEARTSGGFCNSSYSNGGTYTPRVVVWRCPGAVCTQPVFDNPNNWQQASTTATSQTFTLNPPVHFCSASNPRATLTWQSFPGADNYKLKHIGSTVVPIGNTTSTTIDGAQLNVNIEAYTGNNIVARSNDIRENTPFWCVGDISINTNFNNSSWEGGLKFSLIGPTVAESGNSNVSVPTHLDQDIIDWDCGEFASDGAGGCYDINGNFVGPAAPIYTNYVLKYPDLQNGSWTLSYLSGGPGFLAGITPSSTQIIPTTASGKPNLVFTINFSSTPLPDLTAGNPSVNFTNTDHTAVSNVVGAISNIGQANVSSSFQNILQIDTNNNGSVNTTMQLTLSPLNIGVSANLTFAGSSLSNLPAGTHAVRLCADLNTSGVGSVTESNDDNNCGGWVSFVINTSMVNGVCGTANHNYPAGTISYSTDTYCSSGNPSATPAFPPPGGNVYWGCNGINGGTSTPSSACMASVSGNGNPTNGSCSVPPVHYNCSVGDSFNPSNNSTSWTWKCSGLDGGNDSPVCTELKKKPSFIEH